MRQPAPHLNEFFLRGVSLVVALDIRARWDTVTDEELQRIGFTPRPSPAEVY
jgi:hypothetical protein